VAWRTERTLNIGAFRTAERFLSASKVAPSVLNLIGSGDEGVGEAASLDWVRTIGAYRHSDGPVFVWLSPFRPATVFAAVEVDLAHTCSEVCRDVCWPGGLALNSGPFELQATADGSSITATPNRVTEVDSTAAIQFGLDGKATATTKPVRRKLGYAPMYRTHPTGRFPDASSPLPYQISHAGATLRPTNRSRSELLRCFSPFRPPASGPVGGKILPARSAAAIGQ